MNNYSAVKRKVLAVITAAAVMSVMLTSCGNSDSSSATETTASSVSEGDYSMEDFMKVL